MRNPVSRFAYTASDIDIKRSMFPRTQDHKTTMSAGLLYPIFCDEVYPGDTYSVDTASVVRMSTPIHPVMDNCYLDCYWFFVPARLTWEHWKEFMGESPSEPYVNPIEYSIPMLKAPVNAGYGGRDAGIPYKSLLDYLGVPPGHTPEEVNALPVRGFCLIWNEWFRDQNLQNSIFVPLDDSDRYYAYVSPYAPDDKKSLAWDNNNKTYSDAYVRNCCVGGDLPPVNKYHDYFTSALKEPQKGEAVPIPLSGFAPVYGNELMPGSYSSEEHYEAVEVTRADGSLQSNSGTLGYDDEGYLHTRSNSNFDNEGNNDITFNNLAADLSKTQLFSTISDLRYAFQLQKFLEADNRGGTRYRELLRQHFNVVSPDATQQVPEFLGGKRIPINISQVLQTSATNEVTPQGNTAAYSLTSDKYSAFTKSFTEHGWLYCCACLRSEHTYTQGLERMWSRKNKLDFYFPEFANISEQPIYNRELYLSYDNDVTYAGWEKDKEIFGYQEPWAELKYKPNRVSGEFRPEYPQSLDIWHYGDDYSECPVLSSEWIRETRANIDRTLAVSSDVSDQFICDFYFKVNTTRILPVYSIPGLADHH